MFNLFNCGNSFCKECNCCSDVCQDCSGGPCKPSCGCKNNLVLAGLQVALSISEQIGLGADEAIQFNSTITNNSTKVQHTFLDTFTILENGTYLINWQLLYGGGLSTSSPAFALDFSDGGRLYTNLPANSQLVSSTNFINVTNAPVSFKLINTVEDFVYVDPGLNAASLTITHLQNC